MPGVWNAAHQRLYPRIDGASGKFPKSLCFDHNADLSPKCQDNRFESMKLEEWEEARFWGMRTITMIRESMGWHDEDELVDLDAANEVGKIYYRTGVAFKALGDESEARRLLKVAARYLPHDEIVRKELASVALRLG